MNNPNAITGWFSFLRAIVLKPTWEFATTGIVFTFLSVTTWWRDNFASEEWKRRLELKGMLPHWSVGWWLSIALGIILLLAVREAHALWLEQKCKVDELERMVPLPDSAPEVSITVDREPDLGLPESLLIQNVSKDNIHGVLFQIFADNPMFVMWRMPKFNLVRPQSIMQVQPVVFVTGDDGTSSRSYVGFSEYIRLFGEKIPQERPLVPLGEIKFTCLDRRNYRYEISAPLLYTRLENKVAIGTVERRLIKAEPERV